MADKIEFVVQISRLESGRFRVDVNGAGGGYGGPVDTADDVGRALADWMRQAAEYGYDVPV